MSPFIHLALSSSSSFSTLKKVFLGSEKLGKMASEPKRRRINKAPPRRVVSSAATSKDTVAVAAPNDSSTVPVAQASGYDIRMEQAKRYAVAQALQEHSTGNFRIFDSLYGNFLVPVIPTRAELAGTAMTCTVMAKGEELPSLGGESYQPGLNLSNPF